MTEDQFKLFLAYSANPYAINSLKRRNYGNVSVLVSYVYLNSYTKSLKEHISPRWTMLDSGAFSAWRSGKVIDIDLLIEETKNPYWNESVCLDVIKNPQGSLDNAMYMQKHGSPAFPVYHYGEPIDLLKEYCRTFPKVGVSARLGEPVNASYKFFDACFDAVWPHRFHSFGWTSEKMLLKYPFHSADCSTWCTAPASWGVWETFKSPSKRLSIRKQELLFGKEIDTFLERQNRVQARWANQWRTFDAIPKKSVEVIGQAGPDSAKDS